MDGLEYAGLCEEEDIGGGVVDAEVGDGHCSKFDEIEEKRRFKNKVVPLVG